jgi:hypothetical protein
MLIFNNNKSQVMTINLNPVQDLDLSAFAISSVSATRLPHRAAAFFLVPPAYPP